MTCCNQTPKQGFDKKKNLYWYQCPICGKQGKGKMQKEAETNFINSLPSNHSPDAPESTTPTLLQPIPPIPLKKAGNGFTVDSAAIAKWEQSALPSLLSQSASFLDKPYTKRMISKNTRYLTKLTSPAWEKIWSSDSGHMSIAEAYFDAACMGCVLGDMGDLVPFSGTATLIPRIECYEFNLSSGRNPIFVPGTIEVFCIHENDVAPSGKKDGNYYCDLQEGSPRGEVIQVCCMGTLVSTGKTIGMKYDADRLLEKAAQHSPSYRQFLKDREAFMILKSEGKLQKDKVGRECMIEKIPKRDGGTWDKITYESDLTNPYDGPDRPEMLRKTAGKSFFGKFMRVRNSMAMSEEWERETPENRENAADMVLNEASRQFDNTVDMNSDKKGTKFVNDDDIQDADYEEVQDEKPEPKAKAKGDLFDDE